MFAPTTTWSSPALAMRPKFSMSTIRMSAMMLKRFRLNRPMDAEISIAVVSCLLRGGARDANRHDQ